MSLPLLISPSNQTTHYSPDHAPGGRALPRKEVTVEVPAATTEACRSDTAADQMLAEIRRRLNSKGYHVLRLIDCEYCDGAVVLRGRVPTYYLKQIAQSVLLNDPAVKTIANLIEVVADEVSDRSKW